MIGSVGPNVSSCMIRIEWSTSTSTVGSNQCPGSGPRCPPTSARAPLARASLTCASTVSTCGGNVIAPTSTVPGPPSGRPLRSARTLSVTSSTNSSYTGASTYTRSTEMHVCPQFCIE